MHLIWFLNHAYMQSEYIWNYAVYFLCLKVARLLNQNGNNIGDESTTKAYGGLLQVLYNDREWQYVCFDDSIATGGDRLCRHLYGTEVEDVDGIANNETNAPISKAS